MSAKLNIEGQTAKHEECQKILDMIRRNREYMLSDMNPPLKNSFVYCGDDYYKARVEMRAKIQNRLICYYAKKVAALSSEPYEVAMAIREPNQSSIIQS